MCMSAILDIHRNISHANLHKHIYTVFLWSCIDLSLFVKLNESFHLAILTSPQYSAPTNKLNQVERSSPKSTQEVIDVSMTPQGGRRGAAH